MSLAVFACDDDASRGPGTAPSLQNATSGTQRASEPDSSSANPRSDSSSGGSNPSPVAPHVGAFEGSYESKKADIALAPGVRVQDWKRDDGTAASGMGKLTIDISADGQVSGTIDGPLGPGLIRGVYSEGLLSASVSPTDPTRVDSFEGTLSGSLEADSIGVQLAAATADARLARRAEAKLTRVK
jgi:hypothetical protein